MSNEKKIEIAPSASLKRLQQEDAVGQLRRREGLMSTLGSENGLLKLDWVEGIARILENSTQLEEVEAEAQALWQQGIRHLIWAGMGGSVITVRVLADLGFCDSHNGEYIAVYPLDSTDPAALNSILRQIAQAKNITLPGVGTTPNATFLSTLFIDVMMVGVSMGMTSEEPITHLTWFVDLLEKAHLSPSDHLLVMTLSGSYLDHFAHEQQAPSRPLQLDYGTGTGGRMSAPTTRVFLLPAALYLTRFTQEPGQLRSVLSQAWQYHQLDLASTQPEQHPFVQLAAALSDRHQEGAMRMLLQPVESWQAILPWIEQLLEESLGKGNKGIVLFAEQPLNFLANGFHTADMLHVENITEPRERTQPLDYPLCQPYLAATTPSQRLAALAATFLGWQLTMALYGYLHNIPFAGQPAVENYKARARALRQLQDPFQPISTWEPTYGESPIVLLAPAIVKEIEYTSEAFVHYLIKSVEGSDRNKRLGYLDFTINGEGSPQLEQIMAKNLFEIGNNLLGVPTRQRHAPAAYHSTEQSEMDGPPFLISLRLLLRHHEEVILGTYTDAFLLAQAISTWQAMQEQGRRCFLLIIDGNAEQAIEHLEQFFDEAQFLLLED